MATGVLSEVLLPLTIVLIMIAMGMTLTGADFHRLATQRKAMATGLLCQLVLLPAIGFATAWLFGLATLFAISVVLLAASPGGSTSNLIVHTTDHDRALSLTLTGLSNVAVFVTMPLYLGLAQEFFGSLDGNTAVPVADLVVQVAALTVVPIAIGMFIRNRAPRFADRAEGPGKVLSGVVLAVIVLALVIQNWSVIVDDAPEYGPALVAMNAVALLAGWAVATAVGLTRREAGTVGIETGIQNSALAVTIALTVFDNDDLAVVPGLYGLWMLFTGFAFAYLLRSRLTVEPAGQEAPALR